MSPIIPKGVVLAIIGCACLVGAIRASSQQSARGSIISAHGLNNSTVPSYRKYGGQPDSSVSIPSQELGGELAKAMRAIDSRLWQIQSTEKDHHPRSNAARDTLYPFILDMNDSSSANLALIEQRALNGSDDALAAFLILATGTLDYRERSHQLLISNAVRGSVLALTTLADRASVGYGFSAPSIATAIFFEYLAWSTGQWHGDGETESFRPSLVGRWTHHECNFAVKNARHISEQTAFAAFVERPPLSGLACSGV